MTSWRNDAQLAGKFHQGFPDDLQVVVHDGSFRFTKTKAEVVWARIIGVHNTKINENTVYKAVVLNQPHQLTSVKIQQEILLVSYQEYPYSIYVTEEYLKTRSSYIITPCNGCHLPEVFDPIPKLMDHTFPAMKEKIDAGEEPLLPVFSSFCPMCGQTMVVKGKKQDEL